MSISPSSRSLAELQRTIQTLQDHQRFNDAADLQRQIVQTHPQLITPRLQQAHLRLQAGDFDASARVLVEAAGVPDDDPSALIALARRLNFHGEIEPARRCIGRLERLRGTAHLHMAIAQLRWMTGEVDLAFEWVDRAYRAGLRGPDELHLHAMLCHFRGDTATAGRLLDECLGLAPEHGMAAQARANLYRQRMDSAHVTALQLRLKGLRARAEKSPAHALNIAQFEAALAKELDDLGNIPDAWEALSRSKSILRNLNPYDAEAESAITAHIIASLGQHVRPTAFRPGHEPGQPTPIFIVGMPRSGSTLLDRMISAHPEVAPAGEINDFLRQLHRLANVPPSGHAGMHRVLERLDRVDPAELGQRYLEQTAWRARGRKYFVDKLPINVQLVPLIRRALPHAPILHLVRDPMDVCFSNYRAMFGDVSPWCNDLTWVAHFHACYERIVEAWRRDYPAAMIEVSYADLVADPESVLRRLMHDCGLSFDDACLRPERNPFPVTTPSTAQVREPLNRRGVAGWRRYADYLEPLRRALETTPNRDAAS
ncbi:tetratricopeptide repeat-containing sulfotransferase family protein [Dyella ginsengisoli]|uniref:tetratricopeptide repeat-containing sulfotransferase family protein n=1 Tax=Dyella ginsengisoli TaxID=363848 RepID=UPI00034A6916|nr:sulfotransferase [Dyella ginsengisoli]